MTHRLIGAGGTILQEKRDAGLLSEEEIEFRLDGDEDYYSNNKNNKKQSKRKKEKKEKKNDDNNNDDGNFNGMSNNINNTDNLRQYKMKNRII